MASGGTRFTRPARARRGRRTRPVPRMIYVDARAQHETLYDVLVVSPSASSREVRRVARALRRNLPDTSALPDVCLAEQVLGRAELRREYDALLARLRAANQPMPRIGVAIEAGGLGPGVATRSGSVGPKLVTVAGKAIRLVGQVGFVILMILLIAAVTSTCDTPRSSKYKITDIKPIQLPKLDPARIEYTYRPVEIPKIEIPKIKIPKIEIPKIKIPKIAMPKPEIPKPEIPKIEIPKIEIPKIEPLAHAVPSPPPWSAPDSTASDAPPGPADATP